MKNEIVKAILIDPFEQSITAVHLDRGNIDQMYTLIGCSSFEAVALDNGDLVYVDEEGMFPGHCVRDGVKLGFYVDGRILYGRGLIMGVDMYTGESIDCKITIDEISSIIYIHS